VRPERETCREILWSEDGNDTRARAQRRIHALHEIAVGEVPLLEDYPVPFDFNDLANFGGHRHIRGVRTRPADKEIRQCLQNLVHGCLRGGGIKKSEEA
jgi:hypothetical protein